MMTFFLTRFCYIPYFLVWDGGEYSLCSTRERNASTSIYLRITLQQNVEHENKRVNQRLPKDGKFLIKRYWDISILLSIHDWKESSVLVVGWYKINTTISSLFNCNSYLYLNLKKKKKKFNAHLSESDGRVSIICLFI